jgi:hypothetical protein
MISDAGRISYVDNWVGCVHGSGWCSLRKWMTSIESLIGCQGGRINVMSFESSSVVGIANAIDCHRVHRVHRDPTSTAKGLANERLLCDHLGCQRQPEPGLGLALALVPVAAAADKVTQENGTILADMMV